MNIHAVHDWLVAYGGSEVVLEALLRALDIQDVFTAVFDPRAFRDSSINSVRVHVSFINSLPGAKRHHRQYLPLMPMAVEQYDLRAAEIVISNACALAQGVITNPSQLHVAYLNRTMTYAWGSYLDDLEAFGVAHGPLGVVARRTYHTLRQWDYLAFQRPDVILTNSVYSARRVWKHYRRESLVLPPPVALDPAPNFGDRADYFVLVGRLVPVKRPEIVVEAFNRLGLPLKIIGGGPLESSLRRSAKSNIEFLGVLPRADLWPVVRNARGLVLASEEDFGLVSLEAQSSGTPVLALARGGSLETIRPGETGLFFEDSSVEAVEDGVRRMISASSSFEPERLRAWAETFSEARFSARFRQLLDVAWMRYQLNGRITVDELSE